jgi:excisionase family DNA binding protein
VDPEKDSPMTLQPVPVYQPADPDVELPPQGHLMSVPQAAAYLGVSERWLYDEIREGRLAAMYMARAWRIRPEVLDAFADSFTAKPASAGVRRRGQVRR